MKSRVLCDFLKLLLCASMVALAAPPDPVDAVKAATKKDQESAMKKIAADNKVDVEECGKRSGPAANACTIQADAKLYAAEEEARIRVARVIEPMPSEDRQKDETKKQAASAKVQRGAAMARIKNNHNLALAESRKLKGPERTICKKDVDFRTTAARTWAKTAYARSVQKAEAIEKR